MRRVSHRQANRQLLCLSERNFCGGASQAPCERRTKQWGPALPPAPTSPESKSRAGEGLGRPGRGSGRGLSAPVGPLGTLRRSCDLLRFPNWIPTKTLLLCWIPSHGSCRSKLLQDPSQVRHPKARFPAGKSGKSGFGFRLALLSLFARSSARAFRSFRTDPLIRRRPRLRNFVPFPEGQLLPRERPICRTLPSRTSGIFATLPVDNGDIVDKSAVWRAALL